jgi:CheY-like chemotaxis protein
LRGTLSAFQSRPEQHFSLMIFMSKSPKQPNVRTRIIVADDEPLIATTLVEILEIKGFDAEAVSDGVAAVERARRIRPDILLSDVQMPNMNGIEAAKKIRGFLPNCRIVLLSGHAATGALLERARAEGHKFEVLTKPIGPEDLLSALREKT